MNYTEYLETADNKLLSKMSEECSEDLKRYIHKHKNEEDEMMQEYYMDMIIHCAKQKKIIENLK